MISQSTGSNVTVINVGLLIFSIRLTCPCIFIITTVLERLQTTKCSGFLGSKRTALTANSLPSVLKVAVHSVVFSDQIFTVPSDEPLQSNQTIVNISYVRESRFLELH